MNTHAVSRSAWSLVALSALLCAFALLLGLSRITPVASVPGFDLGEALQYLTQWLFVAVGALIVSGRPGNTIGWIFCALGTLTALSSFAYEYAVYGLLTRPGSLPGGAELAWLSSWVWVPTLGLWALLLLLFPNGELPSRRWRWVAWFGLVTTVITAAPGFSMWSDRGPALLRETEASSNGFAEVIAISGISLLLTTVFAAAISLIVRFRHTSGEERQQLKWLAYAAGLVLAMILVNALLTVVGAEVWIPSILFALAFLSIPIATGVAILRYRLYDIDLVINRTLVYGALTACVVGIYVFVVGYLGAIFRTGGNLAISLVATGLVAVLFAPLRDRLQRGINRLMYGERDDPYGVLSRLGERLKATDAPEAVLPTIVETVAGALKLPHAAIALKQDDDGFEIVAEYGSPKGEPLVLPLSYGTETIGRLVLSPRAPGEPFDPADRRLLDDLARHAEAAAYAVRLTADLQRSRERLVNAREEERRRLRRDLHDGLGPQLATLTLKLDAARNLLVREPRAADALLAGLKAQVQAAISDIRRLVYDLRPPALDDLGLIPAIREQATNYGQHSLNVSVETPESLPPLPAAVEVAAYRIVQEALTNVVRHARARACRVRLSIGGGLELEIVDDGVGLSEDRRAGVGLSSMRERAAELGGTCTVAPAGPTGGTRVLARLPLPKDASGSSENPTSNA